MEMYLLAALAIAAFVGLLFLLIFVAQWLAAMTIRHGCPSLARRAIDALDTQIVSIDRTRILRIVLEAVRNHPNDEVRRATIRLITFSQSQIWQHKNNRVLVLSTLLHVIRHDVPQVREAAIVALRANVITDDENRQLAKQELLKVAQDNRNGSSLRSAAIGTLCAYCDHGKANTQIAEALERLFDDGDAMMRYAAIEGMAAPSLAEFHGDAFRRVLVRALADNEQSIRRASIRTMMRLKSKLGGVSDKATLVALQVLLEESTLAVCAAEVLDEITFCQNSKEEKVFDTISRLLSQHDVMANSPIRAYYKAAIAIREKSGVQDTTVVNVLARATHEGSPPVRWNAVKLLTDLGAVGAPDSVRALSEALVQPSTPADLRQDIVTLLGRIAVNGEVVTTVGHALATATNDDSPIVRRAVASALGDLCPGNARTPSIAAVLARLCRADSDGICRVLAAASLCKYDEKYRTLALDTLVDVLGKESGGFAEAADLLVARATEWEISSDRRVSAALSQALRTFKHTNEGVSLYTTLETLFPDSVDTRSNARVLDFLEVDVRRMHEREKTSHTYEDLYGYPQDEIRTPDPDHHGIRRLLESLPDSLCAALMSRSEPARLALQER